MPPAPQACPGSNSRRRRCAIAALAALASGIGASTSAFGASGTVEKLRGYGAFDAELGFISGALAPNSSPAPGFGFELGVGPARLPVMLGLGAGEFVLDTRTERDGFGVFGSSDEIGIAPNDVVRSTTVRHVELELRLEPNWRFVRPFVTGYAGVAALWASVSDRTGTDETQLDAALLQGVSVGLAIEPFGRRRYPSGVGAIGVTLGVRAFEIGNLRDPRDAPGVSMSGLRGTSAFIGVSLVGFS